MTQDVIYCVGKENEGFLRYNDQDCKVAIQYENGDRYVGDILNEQLTGLGTFYYANGEKYEGEFSNGKRHGKGVYYFSNGDTFSGSFKDASINGDGLFIYKNGDRCEGTFLAVSKYKPKNKSNRFSNILDCDEIICEGSYYYLNEGRYEGLFSNCRFNPL